MYVLRGLVDLEVDPPKQRALAHARHAHVRAARPGTVRVRREHLLIHLPAVAPRQVVLEQTLLHPRHMLWCTQRKGYGYGVHAWR